MRVGAAAVVNLARKMHIVSEMSQYPSLALGCVDVSLKEATAAFNVFAHDGVYVEPYMIKWIKNEWGSKIYRYDVIQEAVLDPAVAGKVAKVLSIGMKRYLLRVNEKDFNPEVIAKTGTTNDSRNCWFVGSTKRYTTAIYIGRDDHSPLGKNIYPIPTVFPIWLSLYRQIDKSASQFKYAPSLKPMYINWKTGEEVGKNSNRAIEIFV